MKLSIAALLTSALLLVGCNPPPAVDTKPEGGATVHNHPTEGPHGQPLIELGNEDYHAELVHDDKAGTVTIYILDSGATKEVAIDAAEVTINLKHGDHAEQFPLAAEPDESGKASKFVSTDSHLAAHLDEEGAGGELVVTIDGTQYRGALAHDHDHAHDHGDHEH